MTFRFQNQGQMVAPNWNATALLKNITAYLGTDGQIFLPVFDRDGYTGGRTVQLNTGGTKQSGMPVVIFTSAWISDGQINTLQNTLLSGAESGPVTVAFHLPGAVGRTTTVNANAVLNLNLNQLSSLNRRKNGYDGFKWQYVITERL